ncbi:MAG TPA: sigma-54-dependent Fis family transcriptional regulator [Elusimicrobia bacterium]|nr:MAG: sigma-54-dependent Fis family transcriptional regulator [Elusimicrobia bacterium RIFOXYA12_FULL_49_49]OGS10373.1 MAG: sigma-54-dependent Fis family transcriptional regulator [Elusimicrobia bacterium RIFOXYB1_FULL_48_9]OGS14672.1 MAG: sigma-54-dependent Fis family transcriptional regulator [Elusimicrobia bacterium RIFOXYA2_FULL_47_53]OGS25676.1 MAG: sigma-54-dependent Fis family transcriptional regulator [Elusimicrobia bacterium RIFOXYB12_FULL_50_12]OGS31763.1 MAG: sigma-54-dependent Fis
MKRENETKAVNSAGELSLLFDISKALSLSLDVKEVLGPVLKVMAEHLGLLRGTLTILNRETGEISIEEACGLSNEQRAKGRYKIGEGITGKVVESGKPAVIPRISEEPLFLDRTQARSRINKKEISFICVPIKNGREVMGALSADMVYEEKKSFEEHVRLLTVISSMIAQAVRLRQSAQEEMQKLQEENTRLNEELRDKFRPASIIGNSHGMRQVYGLINKVSKSDATVLILGESGVGKELVAQAIHYNSLRAGKPFIQINAAALPGDIIESELFGHEKGAFTGAASMRKGRFELADGGTLFIDEVGDMPVNIQVKLLRVLQEKCFERVGGSEPIKVDVRIVAATNRKLDELVARGGFREDLFYRLNVFPIVVPPLRERKTDILLLADHFVAKYSKKNRKAVKRISTPAIDMLMSYHWPGNVRELENCVERAVILSSDGVIHGYHLPPSLQTAEESKTAAGGTLSSALESLEKEMISEALKSAKGNMARAARELGLSERIMGLRVGKYKISYKRFRE